MFEVKVYRNTIIRNCKFFSINDSMRIFNIKNAWVYMFPNNDNFYQFWKYRKEAKISPSYGDIYNQTIMFNTENEFNNYDLISQICWFDEDDYILFEFPDEEIAFYFKLKFC